MDFRDGFSNNQCKPSMSYSDILRRITTNGISNPLLEKENEKAIRDFTENKTSIFKFEPSSFSGSQTEFGDPSQLRLLVREDRFSNSLPSHLNRTEKLYSAFHDLDDNIQAAYITPPLPQKGSYSNILRRCYSDNGLIPTLPRRHDNGLTKTDLTQSRYVNKVAETFTIRSNYDNKLAEILTIQKRFDSEDNTGLAEVLPIQRSYNCGKFQTTKLELQHYTDPQFSSRGSRGDYYLFDLPSQHFENEVPLSVSDQFATGTNGCLQVVPPPIRRKSTLANGKTKKNLLIQDNVSLDSYWLPSNLLEDDTETHSRSGPKRRVEDPKVVHVFLAGPINCGKIALIKKFVEGKVDLPVHYDFSQGLTALIPVNGRKILIKFCIIKNLSDAHEVIDRICGSRRCVLILVYNLTLVITLREIEAYINDNKLHFIKSREPIVLVGNTMYSRISSSKCLPTFNGGSEVIVSHDEVKVFCKCSTTTGENVDHMFFLAINAALGI